MNREFDYYGITDVELNYRGYDFEKIFTRLDHHERTFIKLRERDFPLLISQRQNIHGGLGAGASLKCNSWESPSYVIRLLLNQMLFIDKDAKQFTFKLTVNDCVEINNGYVNFFMACIGEIFLRETELYEIFNDSITFKLMPPDTAQVVIRTTAHATAWGPNISPGSNRQTSSSTNLQMPRIQFNW